MKMAGKDDVKDRAFWESPESCVMRNPRSHEGEQCIAEFEKWVEQENSDSGDVWVATSGSSGKPRFIRLLKSSLLHSAEAVNAHLHADEKDRWLCALPVFHVGGLGIYARAAQSNSEVVSIEGKWDAEQFCDALLAHQGTLTSLVPTQVYDLVIKSYQCPEAVRAVLVGGERLDQELGEKARQLGWPVLQTYGMTEAASQVATEPLSALQQKFSGEWMEVLPCWQVRTASGQEGRLEIKGIPLCSGYMEIAEDGEFNYRETGGEDGWYATSDRVELKRSGEDWELKVLGRMDDVVKILGEQVSMDSLNRRFDDVLRQQGNDLDGALLAVPDERQGHHIVGAFVTGDRARIEELVSCFNDQSPPYERIGEAVSVSEIPRSALGKVQRRELLDQIS